MTVCLVVGSADCVEDDLNRLGNRVINGTIAVNQAGAWLPRRLNAWASMHPQYCKLKGWIEDREAAGLHPAEKYYCHKGASRHEMVPFFQQTLMSFPGQPPHTCGSSGLFAAKVALYDLGFDEVIFCGVPIEERPHRNGLSHWVGDDQTVGAFRSAWLSLRSQDRNRMSSMSGWTKGLLGEPK